MSRQTTCYLFLQQIFQGGFEELSGILIEAVIKALFGNFYSILFLKNYGEIVETFIMQAVGVEENQAQERASVQFA